jgi:hypothetical protein
MTSKPELQKIPKEVLTQKRKKNATMKIWGEIHLIRRVDKQMRSREESNTTITTKWQETVYTI